MPLSIHDLHILSNTFSLLGSTFGNFSIEYKKEFLKQLSTMMNKGDTLLISVFNKPNSLEGIQDIIDHYNTPETHQFIKNFFMKLGIPEDNITIQVTYTNNVVHIDALVTQKDPTIPLTIHL